MNDGNGFVFVDHVGEIYPSGFLPMSRGSVRAGALVDVYRHDPVFRQLRHASGFAGRCGRCEFREICGGSRSRAYATTGDAFGEDPLCAYGPGTVASRERPFERHIEHQQIRSHINR